jgi:hypothetical protein
MKRTSQQNLVLDLAHALASSNANDRLKAIRALRSHQSLIDIVALCEIADQVAQERAEWSGADGMGDIRIVGGIPERLKDIASGDPNPRVRREADRSLRRFAGPAKPMRVWERIAIRLGELLLRRKNQSVTQ